MPAIVLDSRYRDDAANSTAASCTFKFPMRTEEGDYALSSFAISGPLYNVYEGANKVYFNDGTDRETTLPDGRYTGTTLAAALKTAMDAVGGANTYTVTYSAETGKITFVASTSAFAFLWGGKSDSVATLAGFSDEDTASATTVISTNIASPESFPGVLRLAFSSGRASATEAKNNRPGYVIVLRAFDTQSNAYHVSDPSKYPQIGLIPSQVDARVTLTQACHTGGSHVPLKTPGARWVAQFNSVKKRK